MTALIRRTWFKHCMKILIAILLFLGVSTRVSALGGRAGIDGAQPGGANGILQSIENAKVTNVGEDLLVTQKDARTPVEMVFTRCQGLGGPVRRTSGGFFPQAQRACWGR